MALSLSSSSSSSSSPSSSSPDKPDRIVVQISIQDGYMSPISIFEIIPRNITVRELYKLMYSKEYLDPSKLLNLEYTDAHGSRTSGALIDLSMNVSFFFENGTNFKFSAVSDRCELAEKILDRQMDLEILQLILSFKHQKLVNALSNNLSENYVKKLEMEVDNYRARVESMEMAETQHLKASANLD